MLHFELHRLQRTDKRRLAVLVQFLVSSYPTGRHRPSNDITKEGGYGHSSSWQTGHSRGQSGSMSRVRASFSWKSKIKDIHKPHTDSPPEQGETPDQAKARGLIEKKTAINLLEAFAVAVKHYLRGEDGIYYKFVVFGF